jgi:5-methyltetrahydrofolate--homocysteine methyltransferase
MKKTDFLNMLNSGPVILDGATGTNLQKSGLPAGVCPEAWVIKNPEILQSLQKNFYEAGSSIVYAFSFGANRIKLARHGLPADSKSIEEINQRLADISCAVRDLMIRKNPHKAYMVAGDLSPTGLFLKPAGELDFDELVEIYRDQVRGLAAAGVDLFVIETMLDLAQARAAVIAVRTECDLPIMVSLTVEKNGRTLSGDSIRSSLLALAALDVQAFGLNCSFGPESMAGFFKELPQIDGCALLAKPNAGIPHLDDEGRTEFDMLPDDFAASMVELYSLGVNVFGGCCGTTPEHIRAMYSLLADNAQPVRPAAGTTSMTVKMPESGHALLDSEENTAMIGSSRFSISLVNWRDYPVLICDSMDDLIDELLDLADDEPEGILVDFNNLIITDPRLFSELLAEVQMNISIPLIFKSDDESIRSLIARYYNGLTAFVSNSCSACNNAHFIKL